VVMLLGGLWHGAKWVFVLWGAYHGLLLALERWYGKKSLYHNLPRGLRIAVTFLLMLFSWVLFRSENLASARRYYGAMFGLAPTTGASALLAADIYAPLYLVVLTLCAVLAFQRVQAHDWSLKPQTWPRVMLLMPLFVFALLVMFSQAFNPFLYFQF
jgi:alginate O-acetyltransferase complex protein AlgI